jgi:hypothetical protein
VELVVGEAPAQSYVGEVGPVEQAGAQLYGEGVERGIAPAEDLECAWGMKRRPTGVSLGCTSLNE